MSGFDPETSSTDQTLMNHGWNSMKSKMRGLSTLNWADGTKVWFSREVGKWIKKRIFPLHLLCVCVSRFDDCPRSYVIDLDQKKEKKHEHLDTVCKWALAAGCVCISVLRVRVCHLTVVRLFKVISVWKVFFQCSQSKLKCQLSSHQQGEIKDAKMSGLLRYAPKSLYVISFA